MSAIGMSIKATNDLLTLPTFLYYSSKTFRRVHGYERFRGMRVKRRQVGRAEMGHLGQHGLGGLNGLFLWCISELNGIQQDTISVLLVLQSLSK